MPQATFVKDVSDQFTGTAKVFELDEPLTYTSGYDDDGNPIKDTTDYVVASATIVPFGSGPETYIFPCDEDGNVASWSELPGSYKGGLDINKAIENLREDW